MKEFTYTIKDPLGLHARPVGHLVKLIKGMDSRVSIIKAGASRSVLADKLMSVMGLGVKAGETVTVIIDGGSEEANTAKLERFFKENL